MSFSRLNYDNDIYKKNLKESRNVGNYQLYPGKYKNKNNCRINFGILGGNAVSLYKGNLCDLESELRLQTKLSSRCPLHKYHPVFTTKFNNGIPSGKINPETQFNHLPGCNMI